MVFEVFTFRIYLTFEKAVILIWKHATFLRLSNLPKAALTCAELDYQKANINVAIHQHLMAHGQHPVELFVDFIMGTDIGLFILPSVTCLSDHLLSASTNIVLLKHFFEAMSHELFFYLQLENGWCQ